MEPLIVLVVDTGDPWRRSSGGEPAKAMAGCSSGRTCGHVRADRCRSLRLDARRTHQHGPPSPAKPWLNCDYHWCVGAGRRCRIAVAADRSLGSRRALSPAYRHVSGQCLYCP